MFLLLFRLFFMGMGWVIVKTVVHIKKAKNTIVLCQDNPMPALRGVIFVCLLCLEALNIFVMQLENIFLQILAFFFPITYCEILCIFLSLEIQFTPG